MVGFKCSHPTPESQELCDMVTRNMSNQGLALNWWRQGKPRPPLMKACPRLNMNDIFGGVVYSFSSVDNSDSKEIYGQVWSKPSRLLFDASALYFTCNKGFDSLKSCEHFAYLLIR